MQRIRSSACADVAVGLSVPTNRTALEQRRLPAPPWQWTDDAEMACSVFAVLQQHGHIDQDALATSFATHHDFDRGYGPAMNRLLRLIRPHPTTSSTPSWH